VAKILKQKVIILIMMVVHSLYCLKMSLILKNQGPDFQKILGKILSLV